MDVSGLILVRTDKGRTLSIGSGLGVLEAEEIPLRRATFTHCRIPSPLSRDSLIGEQVIGIVIIINL